MKQSFVSQSEDVLHFQDNLQMEYVCPNIFFPINPNGVLTIAWLLLDICGINSIVIWNVEKTLTHTSKVNITECEVIWGIFLLISFKH